MTIGERRKAINRIDTNVGNEYDLSLINALDTDLETMERELNLIDSVLDRRPALDDCPTRYAKIERACTVASRAEKAEASLAALAAALRKAYELGVREAAQEAVEAFQALKLHNDDDGTASIVSDFSTFMRAVDALQGLQEILATLPLPADVAELLRRVEG